MLRRFAVFAVVITLCTLFAGCGSSDSKDNEQAKPGPGSILPESDEYNLAELLTKPRAALAELCDDAWQRLQNQVNVRREGQTVPLIPDAIVPIAIPVLREAKFSAAAGLSLPPYLAEGTRDTPLALHLARYGDIEAALQVVERTNFAAVRKLDTGRHFPLEWTRLVGMLLHSGELALAADSVDGAKQVISLHRQLEKVLDGRSPAALRAALLPRGRRILEQARDAWRAAGQVSRADEAETVLSVWPTEAPRSPLPLGGALAALTPIFAANPDGHLLLASSPTRVLDLLALPFPDAGVQTIAAFSDTDQSTTEILILYQTGGLDYRKSGQLAHQLEEVASGTDVKGDGLSAREFRWRGAVCDVAVLPGYPTFGAFVRLGQAGAESKRPALPREFGALTLDRSFEQNRVRVALYQRGKQITVESAAAVKSVKTPAPAPIAQITLEREADHDLVAQLGLHHGADTRSGPALMKILTPLWQLGGAARIEGGREHLDFVWEDSRTRLALRIPVNKDKGPALLASDRGAESTEARVQRARAKDDAERRGRLERNEPFARLPRHLEQLRLGMTRGEAERTLPAAFKRDLTGSIGFTFAGDPDSTAAVVLRELFARQGNDGKATELRARYLEGPAGKGKGLAKLLAQYKSKGGAPEALPNEENRVWADLPGKQTATIVTAWQDDLTRLVARQSGGSLELVLRDVAADAAPSFAHLSRGPEKCTLRMSRDDLLRDWKITKPVEAEGALVLTPAASSPYDAVLVWFYKDRVTRIVARQRGTLNTPAQSAQGVRDAWSRHLATFGWPWRQDFAGAQLQSWGSYDDFTRLRVFWQQERDGCRVFTEWKDLR